MYGAFWVLFLLYNQTAADETNKSSRWAPEHSRGHLSLPLQHTRLVPAKPRGAYILRGLPFLSVVLSFSFASLLCAPSKCRQMGWQTFQTMQQWGQGLGQPVCSCSAGFFLTVLAGLHKKNKPCIGFLDTFSCCTQHAHKHSPLGTFRSLLRC